MGRLLLHRNIIVSQLLFAATLTLEKTTVMLTKVDFVVTPLAGADRE